MQTNFMNMEWDFPHNICRIEDRDNFNMFVEADKIFVSFRFDINTYKSWVVLTARTYENGEMTSTKEVLIPTPEIQLIGGVWSNHVAMRMLDGQKFVSGMLDEVFYLLKYSSEYRIHILDFPQYRKKPMDIIKVDRCFYAPFLYLIDDENEENHNIQYMDFLTENYPEAYHYALKCASFSEYLREYHDKDVEWVASNAGRKEESQ